MIAQSVKLTIDARPYFSFLPPRDNEKLGLASQTSKTQACVKASGTHHPPLMLKLSYKEGLKTDVFLGYGHV